MRVFRWVVNRYRQLENMASHPAVAGGPEIAVDLTIVLGLWCLWVLISRGVGAALDFTPLILIPLGTAIAFLLIDTVVSRVF